MTWSHPWGASPCYFILSRLLGVTPITPGFAHVRIKPQTGKLSYASGIMPTIRGPISVHARMNRATAAIVSVSLPGSVRAEVWLPVTRGWTSRHPRVACVNGRPHSPWSVVSGRDGGAFVVVADVMGLADVTLCGAVSP